VFYHIMTASPDVEVKPEGGLGVWYAVEDVTG